MTVPTASRTLPGYRLPALMATPQPHEGMVLPDVLIPDRDRSDYYLELNEYQVLVQPARSVRTRTGPMLVPVGPPQFASHVYLFDNMWHNGYEGGRTGYDSPVGAAVAAAILHKRKFRPDLPTIKWIVPSRT